MGTRNLTCVYADGEYKAVKYCQWDGHPFTAGQEIINFLVTSYKPKKFKKRLKKSVIISHDEIDDLLNQFGGGNAAQERFLAEFPQLCRDMSGADFLDYLQTTKKPEIPQNDINFAADSLFCEYCYVLDLDKNTFEVYKGFNTEPLAETERFKFLEVELEEATKYYPVRHLETFRLSKKLEKKWDAWLIWWEENRE